MRDKLKERLGSRERFKGVFSKYGLKSAYKGLPPITILLVNVQTIQGEKVTDHLWFNLTKGFQALGVLYCGDGIAFDARVRSYVKGYVGRDEDNREIDYLLSHPTKIEFVTKISREEERYMICPKCSYPNPLDQERCRRCGFQEGAPEAPEMPKAPKLEQVTLFR